MISKKNEEKLIGSARTDINPATLLGLVSLREDNIFDLADNFRVKLG